MLRFLAPLALLASPLAAQEEDISALIAARGLSAAEAELAALPAPTPTERFALGGVRFLGAIERTLQTRYRLGMSGRTIDLPVLRLPVAENPAPEAFDPGVITEIFEGVLADMARAGEPLATIDGEVALRLDLGDLWFDVNGNGARDGGEGVAELGAGTIFPVRFGEQIVPPVVRFDTADAAWLQAYTHFVSGVAEMVLAFPPGEAIERVRTSAAEMEALIGDAPPVNALDYQFSDEVDLAAMVYFALQQQPVAEHTRAARGQFLEMIRLNRRFWAEVAEETDNDAEWIPNARQQSALGIVLPEEAAEAWQSVLADAEALLTGEKLIPHWRFGSAAGINLRRLMEDPVPVGVVEWIQGIGLLPYAEQGERVSAFNWRQFERMVGGQAVLYAILLN